MAQPISIKKVVTRKEHRCWGCGDTFPKGSNLEYTTYVDGGRISSAYWCDTCLKFLDETDFWDEQDEIDIGDLKLDSRYEPFVKSLSIAHI